MKKWRLWIILTLIIVPAVFLLVRFYGNKEASEREYKLATVTRGDIRAIVSSTGRLEPLNTVKVGSQVSGNIRDLLVDFNSLVKKDQVIALIDPATYAAMVEQAKAQVLMAETQLQESQKEIMAAEAGVQSAEAQISSTRATLKEAELRYNRLSSLGHKEIVPQSDLDLALAKRDSVQGDLLMAEANLRTAKARLNRTIAQEKGVEALIADKKAALNLADIKLRYCTIQSPIDGVVISRDVDIGQTVAATLQSPILFTIAEDLTRMQVEADVSEADVGQIKPDQEVIFTVDAFPEKKFKATVRQVRNFATNIQNVVTYQIIADVNNMDLLLRPGMTANVTIVVAKVSGVLKVPNAALRFKPPEEIKEEKPAKTTPIREREFYKNTVNKAGLDSRQADELVKIIEQAGQKLKSAYAIPEEDRDLTQAWSGFYTQVFTNLYKILREDQYGKFKAYVEECREAGKKRRMYKGRMAKVYVLGENGQPEVRNIMAGITDDTETQIISGGLEEGSKVIVGLGLTASRATKETRNLFSALLGRRQQ
jgi:HlyD family secretion protein